MEVCVVYVAMYDAMTERLDFMEQPWNNCVAVGVDNTNANIGKKNSIKSRLAVVNNSIYIQGCPCHIIHNTAKAGCSALSKKIQSNQGKG